MKAFAKAEWIWKAGVEKNDEYADFLAYFNSDKSKKQILKISADSNYTVYINGSLAGFGQYADYPNYKVYDEIDISGYTHDGKNRMIIVAWYYGEDTQTYIHGDAGVIFEISQDNDILVYSEINSPSRASKDYISHRCEMISGQLGYTYHYDMRKYDNFIEYNDEGFSKSRLCPGISTDFTLRPIKKLELRQRMSSRIKQQGIFSYTTDGEHPSNDMQYAFLGFRYMSMLSVEDMQYDFSRPVFMKTEEKCDGIYFIVDLSEECAGFLDIDIETEEDCIIDIGYGEHLCDGRCRTSIRDFSCRYYAKKGENKYMNTFRRFGCRYLQFFCHTKKVNVRYAGIRPTLYPVKIKKYDCGNLLRNTIYEVCVNTLVQCMHEHYEDCPWREQALYTMDSRNQMLCGYYAFDEYEFARASLKLISKGLRKDGLLSLCYPAGKDFPIPSFSAVYFMQMYEYIFYSHDITLASECFGVLEKIADTFIAKQKPEGYIENFYGYDENRGSYWNFYEWTPTMSSSFVTETASIETPINAFFSLAMQYMAKICASLGKSAEVAKYEKISEAVNLAIEKYMYNEKTGLFESFNDRCRGEYSVLTNALCLLCGAAQNVNKDNIIKILVANGQSDTGLTVYPNTLSMNGFRFDALLGIDWEKYKNIILDEIDRDYLFMLREGATTFWETISGEKDFGSNGAGAGSLCHGWSALPVYYYSILL